MPIYEYRCGACGHHLEALQKMTDGPLRKCPDCGKSQLRRLVSAPQFRLKGSGWYETDFKKQNETKRNLVEKAGADSGEGASKPTDTAAKEEAGKPAADAKKDDAKPAQAKPASAEPSSAKPSSAKPSAPPRRKPAAKSSTKAARR
jgi:putative FmdB family regulatory protein